MNTIKILQEIIEIAKGGHANADVFGPLYLPLPMARGACDILLRWLIYQSDLLQIEPRKLTRAVSAPCIDLINLHAPLQEIFQIRGDYLTFADPITESDAKNLMLYARDNYEPSIVRFTTKYWPRAMGSLVLEIAVDIIWQRNFSSRSNQIRISRPRVNGRMAWWSGTPGLPTEKRALRCYR